MKYLVSLLLMANVSVAYCGLLPDNVKPYELQDFSGGLNTAVPAHKLDQKFSPGMRNVFIHRKPGSIIQSNGFILAGSTSTLADGRFMFIFNKESGAKEFIVSDGSTVLSTSDFTNYVLVSSGLNNSVNLDAAQVRNKVWLTNGSDPVVVWDGTNRQILNHVPKARYIEFFQERVFLLNTSAEGSSLDFSDISSTDAVALAPEDVRAWPSTNRKYVGRGDGEVGTALFTFKGQLQVGKENSIFTLFGTGVDSYYLRKVESDAGIQSNDSVAIKDGVVYYKSRNGIYAWDGGTPQRISDAIEPDVTAMLSFDTRIIQNIWETNANFALGTFYGSTSTADGFLTIRTDDVNLNYACSTCGTTSPPSGGFIQINSTTNGGSTPWQVVVPTFTVDQNYRGRPNKVTFWGRSNNMCGGTNCGLTMNLKNGTKLKVPFATFQDCGNTAFTKKTVTITNSEDLHFSGSELNTSSFSIQITSNSDTQFDTCVFDIMPSTRIGDSDIFTQSTPESQYISEVRNRDSLSAWSTFDSVYFFNGPLGSPDSANNSLTFYLRTSTSSVNISTQQWVAMSPGVTIGQPIINKYFQWASTINYANPTMSPDKNNPLYLPYIDNVTIQDIEGAGDLYRPTGITWNNEYWLTVSTQTALNTSLTYVKSWITNPNPNAWNLLDGMNIRSFAKNGNSALYGGSASTGAFYRLDYGTNYNGSPIVSYYDTPDMDMGLSFTDKSIQVLSIDAEKESNATLSVGISTSAGVTFSTTVAVNLNGSGGLMKPIFGLSTLKGNTFRLRFSNAELDKGMTVYGAALWYLPREVWTNTGQ